MKVVVGSETQDIIGIRVDIKGPNYGMNPQTCNDLGLARSHVVPGDAEATAWLREVSVNTVIVRK